MDRYDFRFSDGLRTVERWAMQHKLIVVVALFALYLTCFHVLPRQHGNTGVAAVGNDSDPVSTATTKPVPGALLRLIAADRAAQAAKEHATTKPATTQTVAEWRDNYDVAVLATFMGVPKEGPSAGICIVTGIVSALTGRPVRNDLAMTGEITIMGKVLPVGGVQEKIRAAVEAGAKEVLIPKDNLTEADALPPQLRQRLIVTPVNSVSEVLAVALLSPDSPTACQGDT